MNLTIDNDITLVSYYPNYKRTLLWYLDRELVRNIDNTDTPYTLENLKRMYKYQNTHGYLYYIKYKNRLVGDVGLNNSGEVCIAISKNYQDKHIGTRVIKRMISFAKEHQFLKIYAHIYSFNKRSQKMFKNLGFIEAKNDLYVKDLVKE